MFVVAGRDELITFQNKLEKKVPTAKAAPVWLGRDFAIQVKP